MLLLETNWVALIGAKHHTGEIERACECPDVNSRSVLAGHRILSNLLFGRTIGILHRPVEWRHLRGIVAAGDKSRA